MREMNVSVTSRAERNQIFFNIPSERAPKANMVDLEIGGTTTPLTAPSIPFKYLTGKFLIGDGVQSNSRLPLPWRTHDPFATRVRNSILCGCGSRAKSRSSARSRASGFPPSRLAPARKSAQIISRQ